VTISEQQTSFQVHIHSEFPATLCILVPDSSYQYWLECLDKVEEYVHEQIARERRITQRDEAVGKLSKEEISIIKEMGFGTTN